MTLAILATVLSLAAFTYFIVRFFQLRSLYRGMTPLEQRYAEIHEARAQSDKVGIKDRLHAELRRLGLAEDLFPLFAAAAFLYVAVAVPLRLTGLDETITMLAAVPVAAATAWGLVIFRAQRRRGAFNKQLIDLLDLVNGQILGGVGAERALNMVTPRMPDPIRSEMLATLSAGQAGKDLLGAMRELADRYPSRAFDMFIAALEIDRAEGHAIGAALTQASDLLKRDFALAAEAKAEIAQTKFEFLGVAGIVVGLCLYLVFGSGQDNRDMYFSAAGLVALAIGAGNVALGGFRFFRMMNKVKGDT